MYPTNYSISRAQRTIVASLIVLAAHASTLQAQYTTAVSQNSASGLGQGLLTSPEVGNVEGIQRFGESLRTDPDQGIGYTYRVFPSAPQQPMDQESFLWAVAHIPEAFDLKKAYIELAQATQLRQKPERERGTHPNGEPIKDKELDEKIAKSELEIAKLRMVLNLALGGNKSSQGFSRYAPGPNTTAGFRMPATSQMRNGTSLANNNSLGMQASGFGVSPLAIGAGPNISFNSTQGFTDPTLYHQPLIQIKVRLIEATRRNSADFRSVLDYISRQGTPGNVQGNNINGNRRTTRAGTRLPISDGVINTPALPAVGIGGVTGSGALINLTTDHINFVTNMLVTEFSGDVLTVPEVTTLNGQNVEFVAGAQRPLPLGLTTTTGAVTVRQDVFYKHIGTLLSITPRIVNWGKHLEGDGEAPLVAQDIDNWNRLAQWMSDNRNVYWPVPADQEAIRKYATSGLPVPIETKTSMLKTLEQYSAKVLRERLCAFDAQIFEQIQAIQSQGHKGEILLPRPVLRCPSGLACDWKPEDCTIDLEILVRESNLGPGATETANSIANIIQVKSGHGAIMGGLIGMSEIESISKVPLLGDLPAVGYFFRSKAVDRAKSELLILVEASVLPNPHARTETARDFQLAKAYVEGDLRSNPLEVGLHRAGFGEYLPQASPKEDEYWIKHGQKMRKVATELDDTFK